MNELLWLLLIAASYGAAGFLFGRGYGARQQVRGDAPLAPAPAAEPVAYQGAVSVYVSLRVRAEEPQRSEEVQRAIIAINQAGGYVFQIWRLSECSGLLYYQLGVTIPTNIGGQAVADAIGNLQAPTHG